ncbi:MAG: GNAT family N-acetyltransferase [Candidatus Micrarchaeota archaeon]|nr:GNAT family N-acetyltransferase [Candidatus Micrarchaeota archaeon]
MVIIRKARKSDKGQLLHLQRSFSAETTLNRRMVSKKLFELLQYHDYEQNLKDDIRKYIATDSKKGICFVAEENEKLIGVIFGLVKNQPKKVLHTLGYVNDWFVLKECRGKGVGKLLWLKMMAWFRKRRCKAVELKVYPNNKSATAVYRKLGLIDTMVTMSKKL